MTLAEYIAPGRIRVLTLASPEWPAPPGRLIDHDDAKEMAALARADEQAHRLEEPPRLAVERRRQRLELVDGWREECGTCESAPARCGCDRE